MLTPLASVIRSTMISGSSGPQIDPQSFHTLPKNSKSLQHVTIHVETQQTTHIDTRLPSGAPLRVLRHVCTSLGHRTLLIQATRTQNKGGVHGHTTTRSPYNNKKLNTYNQTHTQHSQSAADSLISIAETPSSMALTANIGPWPPLTRFRNLTLIDNWQDSLDEWSARRKAATYTGQHKHRINADKHPYL
jgi:hypothetical protein